MSRRDPPRVLVVGSGPSAAISAKALVDRGVRVLMLESGRRAPNGLVIRAAGRILVRHMGEEGFSTGDRHESLGDDDVHWFQAVSPGGLSNHWTSAVPRFAPDDFDDGARLDPAYRWPIAYDDLVPHYELVEELMTITAGLVDLPRLPRGVAAHRRDLPDDWAPVASAASEIGHDLAVLPLAAGPQWLAARRGTEFNSFVSIVRPLIPLPEFELRTGVHVTTVLPPDADGRPGVTARVDGSDEHEEFRADAVVLGAGSLATTRILLASRSTDAPDGIGNERGVLGRYLHDHPRAWWPFATDRRLTLPDHLLYLTRGEYASSPPLTGRAWTIGLRSSRQRPASWFGARGREFGVQVFGTVVPRREQRVELLDERDDLGDAKLGIAIEFSPDEIARMQDAADVLGSVFAGAGIEYRPDGEVGVAKPGSSVHFGGTARMHDDPALGVVDAWNRVHGMPRIIVCDKSCFTTGPEKNPTLTMMAVAHRAAARLAADLTGDADDVVDADPRRRNV